ncbi:unnamed protein product [Protopolystoma xenopodis]|uniref:Uncharacterized protein n=1 Tax=Protopolystoma xenopodis TaxID=117903 RepID=A0A3S5C7S7_9PLAT|nr:unnamed protein product [Protopolystoma xenopodis]
MPTSIRCPAPAPSFSSHLFIRLNHEHREFVVDAKTTIPSRLDRAASATQTGLDAAPFAEPGRTKLDGHTVWLWKKETLPPCITSSRGVEVGDGSPFLHHPVGCSNCYARRRVRRRKDGTGARQVTNDLAQLPSHLQLTHCTVCAQLIPGPGTPTVVASRWRPDERRVGLIATSNEAALRSAEEAPDARMLMTDRNPCCQGTRALAACVPAVLIKASLLK